MGAMLAGGAAAAAAAYVLIKSLMGHMGHMAMARRAMAHLAAFHMVVWVMASSSMESMASSSTASMASSRSGSDLVCLGDFDFSHVDSMYISWIIADPGFLNYK